MVRQLKEDGQPRCPFFFCGRDYFRKAHADLEFPIVDLRQNVAQSGEWKIAR